MSRMCAQTSYSQQFSSLLAEFSERIEEKTARTKSAASVTLKGLAVLNKSNTLNTLMENFFRWYATSIIELITRKSPLLNIILPR